MSKRQTRNTMRPRTRSSEKRQSKDSRDDDVDSDEIYYNDLDLNSSPIKRLRNSLVSPKRPKHNTHQTTNEEVTDLTEDSVRNVALSLQNLPPDSPVSSSPIKYKKSVTFSDDLVSDVPSSPTRQTTPRKSILKASFNHNFRQNEDTWPKKTPMSPSNPQFWQPGSIVQLPPNSPELPQLVAGCISVLQDEIFDKRFEVYATLNAIYKTNAGDSALKLFTITLHDRGVRRDSNHIIELAKIVRRDVLRLELRLFEEDKENERSEDGTSKDEKDENLSLQKKDSDRDTRCDPFTIRVINQALKLVNFFMLDMELNNFMPLDEVRWLYAHASEIIIRPAASKALISAYILLIRDCKFSPKKKRVLFSSSELPEKMLTCVVNMRPLPSSSLVSERFMCIKNFALNIPQIMAKNIKHWFALFVANVVGLEPPFYAKCIGAGVSALLEIARAFLAHRPAQGAIRDFMHARMPSVRSICYDGLVDARWHEYHEEQTLLPFDEQNDTGTADLNNRSNGVNTTGSDVPLAVDAIAARLEQLVHLGEAKNALDIWIALTLLVGDAGSSFDKWPHLARWLWVPKTCFHSHDADSQSIALASWRAVVYNVCHNDLDDLRSVIEPIMRNFGAKERQQAVNVALKPKIKLVTHLFSSAETTEQRSGLVEALNNVFMALLFCLVNPVVIKQDCKYLHIYWDKIIQPVMLGFYFSRSAPNALAQQQGLRVLSKLVKNSVAVTERSFNDTRCLLADPVTLNEINSLPARWVHARFERVLDIILVVLKLENITVEQKVNFLVLFLNTIRTVTKKEHTPSDATDALVGHLPHILDTLLACNPTYEMVFKIMVNLTDTFGLAMLSKERIDGKVEENKEDRGMSSSVYVMMFRKCVSGWTSSQVREMANHVLFGAVSPSLLLEFIKMNAEVSNKELGSMITQALNNRSPSRDAADLRCYGQILQVLSMDYEIFTKKVIQSVVALTDNDEIRGCFDHLRIQEWNAPVFKYYVTLVHNAPNSSIQSFTVDCIASRLKNSDGLLDMVRFLTDAQYDIEILELKDAFLLEAKQLEGFICFEFEQVWKRYLKIKYDNEEFGVLDKLLRATYEVTDYDLLPYTFGSWAHLPLLREIWKGEIPEFEFEEDSKEDPKEDPKEEVVEQVEELAAPEPPKRSTRRKKLKKTESLSSDVESQAESPAKATPTKTKKSSKVKKQSTKSKKVMSDPVEMDEETKRMFDIHSFTAMLTAKLSPAQKTPKKKSRSKKARATKDVANEQETVGSPRSGVDYSKMMENGFLEREKLEKGSVESIESNLSEEDGKSEDGKSEKEESFSEKEDSLSDKVDSNTLSDKAEDSLAKEDSNLSEKDGINSFSDSLAGADESMEVDLDSSAERSDSLDAVEESNEDSNEKSEYREDPDMDVDDSMEVRSQGTEHVEESDVNDSEIVDAESHENDESSENHEEIEGESYETHEEFARDELELNDDGQNVEGDMDDDGEGDVQSDDQGEDIPAEIDNDVHDVDDDIQVDIDDEVQADVDDHIQANVDDDIHADNIHADDDLKTEGQDQKQEDHDALESQDDLYYVSSKEVNENQEVNADDGTESQLIKVEDDDSEAEDNDNVNCCVEPEIGHSYRPENPTFSLQQLLNTITKEDLQQLSQKEIYDLESEMMRFMLRMRER